MYYMEMHFKKTTYMGIIGMMMVMGMMPLLSSAQIEPEVTVGRPGPVVPPQTKVETIEKNIDGGEVVTPQVTQVQTEDSNKKIKNLQMVDTGLGAAVVILFILVGYLFSRTPKQPTI